MCILCEVTVVAIVESHSSVIMTDTSRTKEKKKEIEILFEYQGHRSILKCKRSKILENIEKSLVDLQLGGLLPQSSASPEPTAIKVHTLQSSRRVRGKPGKKYYLLQRYVKDWSAFINVDSIEQVRNRDTLTIAQTVVLTDSTNGAACSESKTESADRKVSRKVSS